MSSQNDFITQYGPLAEQVGSQTGISPDLILSHWALETGWGKSVIPGTNNLGNIKDMSGGGVKAKDNMTGSMDAYRAYTSPERFAEDFTRLLKSRYPNVLDVGNDAKAFATGLQKAGYAEDPNYAQKIVATSGVVRKGKDARLNDLEAKLFAGGTQAQQPPTRSDRVDELEARLFPADQEDTPTGQQSPLRVEINGVSDQPAPAANTPEMKAPTTALNPLKSEDVPTSLIPRSAIEETAKKSGFWGGKEKFELGVISGVEDAVHGTKQLATRVGSWLGLTNQDDIKRLQDQVRQRDEAWAPITSSTPGFVGNIAGNIGATVSAGGLGSAAARSVPAAGALVSKIPLVGRVLSSPLGQAVASGTAIGSIAPTRTDHEGQEGAALGAAAGAAGHLVPRVLARGKGTITPTPQAKKLLSEGVTPTPGQALGGALAKAESKAQSLPLVGSAVTEAKERAIDQFHQAAVRKAIPDGVSKEAIENIQNKDAFTVVEQLGRMFNDKYTKALKGVVVKNDIKTTQKILERLDDSSYGLTDDVLKQARKMVTDQIEAILKDPNTKVVMARPSAAQVQKLESTLNKLATERFRAGQPDFGRLLSDIADDVGASWRSQLPKEKAAALKSLDAKYGQYSLLRKSAQAGRITKEGEKFTPSSIDTSARLSNPSLYAKGLAKGQDLARAGTRVLNEKVPNSGTADRVWGPAAVVGGMVTGGAPGVAGMAGAWAGSKYLYSNDQLRRMMTPAGPKLQAIYEGAPTLTSALAAALLNSSNKPQSDK